MVQDCQALRQVRVSDLRHVPRTTPSTSTTTSAAALTPPTFTLAAPALTTTLTILALAKTTATGATAEPFTLLAFARAAS